MMIFKQAWGLNDIKDTCKNYPTREALWRRTVRNRSESELNSLLMRLSSGSLVQVTIFDSWGLSEVYEHQMKI